MGFLDWFSGLFGAGPKGSPRRQPARAPARDVREAAATHARSATAPPPPTAHGPTYPATSGTSSGPQPAAALPAARAQDALTDTGLARRRALEDEGESGEVLLDPRASIFNLDRGERMTVLIEDKDEEILFALSARIDAGRFEIPQLPSTSIAAIEMCNRTSADIAEIAELITTDPLLSGELLRIANSVLYATLEPAVTLHDAVMRVGLRNLRGLILSASMRGVLLNAKGLGEYAEEVWRQSVSVALIAREIAKPIGFEREKAYALGLLHDVGKVALLALLRRVAHSSAEISPALIGRVFMTLHERAGAAMARAWRLPPEIISVAGCHHDPAANTEYPRSAALARLAHQIDLFLCLGDEDGYRELVQAPAFDVLALPDAQRYKVLELGREAFQKGLELVQEAKHARPQARPAGRR